MFEVNELIKATDGIRISGRDSVSIRGVSVDSRTIKKGQLFIAIKGNRFDGHDFIDEAIKRGASAVLASKEKIGKKKCSCTIIKVRNTLKALAQLAAYHRKRFNIPVIGITGSNGKTTTKEMVAWILEARFKVLKNPGTQNNQIGLALSLLKLDRSFDVAVLEMGTNHFGEIAYLSKVACANIGIINNIAASHLEFFKNLEGVYREKRSLIDNLIPPYVAILNMDDYFLQRESKQRKRFVMGFAIRNNADFKASGIKRLNKRVEFCVNSRCAISLNTVGRGNIYNALAAICVARLLGLDYNIIAARFKDFPFPSSRLNFIHKDNINFIDDTYNSNPLSLEEAMEALDRLKVKGRKILIMGDMLELGRHKEKFHRLAGKRASEIADVLVTVGRLARFATEEVLRLGFNPNSVFNCETCEEAREILFRLNPNNNDIILVKGSRSMQMEKVLS